MLCVRFFLSIFNLYLFITCIYDTIIKYFIYFFIIPIWDLLHTFCVAGCYLQSCVCI